jgi:hypothetical protein
MTIMKQLIESMIEDYLNESYEDDLVEEIFDEISEETWEAIHEAILNELSPELKARYAKKAAADAVGRGVDAGSSGLDKDGARKLANRGKGVDTAMKKLGAKKADRAATNDMLSKAVAHGANAGHQDKMGLHGTARDTASHARANLQGVQHNIEVMKKNKNAKELSGAKFQKNTT